MGGGASTERDVTIVNADNNDIITKLRKINPKKLTLADCRNKLSMKIDKFYFVDESGIEVLKNDELILATEIMTKKSLDLYVKLENISVINSNNTSNLGFKSKIFFKIFCSDKSSAFASKIFTLNPTSLVD